MRIIAGIHKNRLILTPKGLSTRPTTEKVRAALFNICQGYIKGAHFLDLFAGSGAMGLEALSRGAASATFIENDKASIRCLQQNIRTMGCEDQTKIWHGDVFLMMDKLAKHGNQFGIIYADPPYATAEEMHSYNKRVLFKIDQGALLAAGGDLFLEESAKAPVDIEELTTLTELDPRRFGKSTLHQYRRVS